LNFYRCAFEGSGKNLKEVTNSKVSRTALEQPAKEGDSPVSENFWNFCFIAAQAALLE